MLGLVPQAIFWISVFALAHTYVLYPLLVRWLASRCSDEESTDGSVDNELPQISVIMSAFNEEPVIREKMASLAAVDYPPGKLHIYVGSDASDDETDAIMAELAASDPAVDFTRFDDRRGKAAVVNDLVAQAIARVPVGKDHVFILTDASVMVGVDTFRKMAAHFVDGRVTMVDSLITTGSAAPASDGDHISATEGQYMGGELKLKHAEGKLWGVALGPAGGCYALRSDRYTDVPTNALVDDFYIAMAMFEKGGVSIVDPTALCYEDSPDQISEEFRRKARIGAGNFQNLARFKALLVPPWEPVAFAFLSHKVLRWLGPLFLLGALLGSGAAALMLGGPFRWLYALAFVGLASWLFLIPLADLLLGKLGIVIKPLRAIRYFNMMNLALAAGFKRYLGGIEKGTWAPTKRVG